MGDRRQPGGGKAPRRHSLRPRVARPDSWNAKCLISTSPPKLSPPASLSPPPPPSPSPAGLVLLPPPPARSRSPGADQVTTPNRTTHLTPPGPFLAPFPLPHFWINNLPSLPISFSLPSCRRQRGRSAQHIVPSEYVVRRRKVNLAGVRIRCTTLSQPLVKIVCVAPRLPTDRKPVLSKHANCSAPNGPDRPSFKGHLQSRALSCLPPPSLTRSPNVYVSAAAVRPSLPAAVQRRRRFDDILRVRVLQRAAAYGITGIYFIALNFGKRGTRAGSAVAVAGNNILRRSSIIEDEDAAKKVRAESGGGRRTRWPRPLLLRAPEAKFTETERASG